ncbi:HU family DNA-binding protein [Acidithiobacillus sp. MC6.1]|nr:HU family DNA-binding protein [Acidithiobacillus sp. MC6.1]
MKPVETKTLDNLTLTHVAQDISVAIGLPLSTTRDIMALMVDRMAEGLVSGRALHIRGLGTIKPVLQKARNARNPITGEAILVPERRTLRFKASAELIRLMRQE